MRRRFLILFLAVLPIALYAHAAVNPEYELDDPLANDAAALAYIQANFWDTNADGTGTAREGQCYYNTTDDTRRCYDGAGWIETDANTTVAGLAHTQGTDQGLDTGGANAVTAAQAKAASDHVSADGSSHTYIDQDVTSGSSPTLDGNNFTGVDADDVDIVSAMSGNLAGDTTVDAALATLDAASLGGGDTFIWDVDLSGTYDWQANGDGSQDPTSGIIAHNDVTSFTTLDVGGGVITFADSASGAATNVNLYLALGSELPDLNLASEIVITANIDLANFNDNNANLIGFFLYNADNGGTVTEQIGGSLWSDATVPRMRLQREVNDALAQDAANVAATNWGNAAQIRISDVFGHQDMQFYDTVAHALSESPGLTQTTLHCRDGDGTSPHLMIWIRCGDGGNVSGTISSIKIVVK